MLPEVVVAEVVGKCPVFEREGVKLVAEERTELGPIALAVKHFRRVETLEQLIDIGRVALRRQKFTRRYVEEGNAKFVDTLTKMNGGEVVVAAPVEYVVVERHTRRNQFSNAPFHNAFGHGRVFELVADGYALARPHQLGQVGIQRMVRKTSQLFVRPAVVALGERDAQNAAGFNGIFAEGFVEITHPEKQQRTWILGFHLVELLVEGRFFGGFIRLIRREGLH